MSTAENPPGENPPAENPRDPNPFADLLVRGPVKAEATAENPRDPNPFADSTSSRPGRLPPTNTRRSGGVTAISIIAIVLGALGGLSGAAKAFNLIFGARMQQMIAGLGAVSAEQRKSQEAMNAALLAEMDNFLVANTLLTIVQLVLCVGLIYGGVKTFGLKLSGRKILLATFACLLLYESAQLVTFVLMQLRIAPIMEVYMPRVMQGTPGAAPGMEKFGAMIARFSIIAGLVVQFVWAAIKLLFYGFSIRFLRQDQVAQLFTTSATPTSSSREVP